jgi:hypothetical protein
MKKIIIAALCIIYFTGTIIAQDIGDRFAVSGEVMQALSKGRAALVMTQDYKIVYVESTSNELFYDGKKINKTGTFDGVYTYETKDRHEKIVPKVIF